MNYKERRKRSLLILLPGLLYFLAGCGDNESSNSDNPGETAGTEEKSGPVIPVHVQPVVGDTFYVYTSATGTIRPVHAATVRSESSGRVTAVDFEVGHRVGKGQRLVQLDDELLGHSRDQAEANLRLARTNADKAARDLERNEKLFSQNAITESQLEAARLQAGTTEASHLAARAAFRIAERRLRDARITSPIDGQVSEKPVDIGQNVDPGNPVARIVDISRVKVEIGITQEDVPRVRPGQAAMVRADAYPGRDFPGEVLSVSPEAALDSRTFQVQVIVPNKGPRRLLPGMTARVNIEVDRIADTVLIPTDAVLERGGKYIVFVMEGDRARQRTVTTGGSRGDRTVVVDGLSTGDAVIVTGQENLNDGATVRVETEG